MESTCMDLNVKLMRSIGSWPHWSITGTWQERFYKCYSMTVIGLFFIYVMIQMYGLSVYYSTWKSLDIVIEDLIVVITAAIAFVKMVLIIRNQDRLQKLIDYINNDLNKRQIISQEDVHIVKNGIKHEKRLTKTYIGFAYCITALYTTSSIVKIIKFRSSTEYHDTLPLKYPFHLDRFPMYHIAYIHQIIIMIVMGQVGTGVDSFFSCLVNYISGHFIVVSNRIRRQSGMIEKESVEYHREIMRLIERVQSIFGSLLMFQFCSTSFLICLGIFQVTQITDIKPIYYVKCMIYLAIKLTQLFLYCWCGQEIIERSTEVGTAGYSTMWYVSKDKHALSNLNFIMARSQKPVQMWAGYFVVSLNTFKAVMNTAYTYFTLLNTLDG